MRFFIVIAGLLVLAGAGRAQDDKDAIIRKLTEKIALQQKEAEILRKAHQDVTDRLKKEIDLLNKVIKDREVAIVKAELDVRAAQLKALNAEERAKTHQIRMEALLEQVRDLTIRIARLEAGSRKDAPVRNPNDPNPPLTAVSGKIKKVEDKLVQIDLGSDHGLKEGHTLEVYRLQPRPEYLGMLRVIEVSPTTSVCRLVTAGKGVSLKAGDLVASKILDQRPDPGKVETPKK